MTTLVSGYLSLSGLQAKDGQYSRKMISQDFKKICDNDITDSIFSLILVAYRER